MFVTTPCHLREDFLEQHIGRGCNGCARHLSNHAPEYLYQTQKIIQNTVRVPSSLYTMNLAALNAYERPKAVPSVVEIGGATYIAPPGVNWNQMSDRKQPHIQTGATASGSTYHSSSTRHSITRMRPGALNPGGNGVDIKHNSYDRYLNRLKGKAPVRRGIIPPHYGRVVPFNPAYPIYGAKEFKANIVAGCNCPIVDVPAVDEDIV